jgi:Protein of unknown function (DUF3631)
MTGDLDNAALDAIAIEADGRQGEQALNAVFEFLARFVSYPSKDARVAHTLWCAHAHLMERWDSTPRIAFLSAEPASGKTRALEITELLVPNPVAAVNVSPAYLFRKVGNGEGATILYDEIDTVFGPRAKENEEIRGLLNAGHRRGAVAGRCVVKGKEIVTEELPAYSAVALAGLGWLPETILSRSVIVRMRRRSATETVEPYRRRTHAPEGERIRGMLERWARSLTIDGWPAMPPQVQDRDADVWEALIAVADAAGGSWPERARVAAVTLVTDAREAEPSLGIRLLTDVRTVFADRDRMPTKAILAGLIALEESPWGDLKGKPIDERGLSKRLGAYGIKSMTVRVSGASPAKGYRREDLHDAWSRYLPPSPDGTVTSVTQVTAQQNQSEFVTDVTAEGSTLAASVTNSHCQSATVIDVTHVTPLPEDGGDDDGLSIPASIRRCEQCGGMPDGKEQFVGGLWLHRECVRFWNYCAGLK